jgi:hypothetical protein
VFGDPGLLADEDVRDERVGSRTCSENMVICSRLSMCPDLAHGADTRQISLGKRGLEGPSRAKVPAVTVLPV